jgi:hypothetical protein
MVFREALTVVPGAAAAGASASGSDPAMARIFCSAMDAGAMPSGAIRAMTFCGTPSACGGFGTLQACASGGKGLSEF